QRQSRRATAPRPASPSDSSVTTVVDPKVAKVIKIQAHFRRFIVKTKVLPAKIDAINALRFESYSLVESLIEAFILEDFIPDVLVEVLAGQGKDYDESDTDEETDATFRKRERTGIFTAILDEALPPLIRETCGEIVAEILDEYLDAEEEKAFRAGQSKKNPVHVIAKLFFDEIVAMEAPTIAKEVVNETVSEFLLMKSVTNYYEAEVESAIVAQFVTQTVRQTVHDMSMEDIAKQLVEEVCKEMCRGESEVTLPEMREGEAERMAEYEFDLVNAAASRSLMMSSVLTSLATTAGHKGETLIMTSLCNSILHRTIASRLTLLVQGVENSEKAAEEAFMFRDVREALCCEMGVEKLLEMLEEECELEEALVQERELEEKRKKFMSSS
ncbi:hypothetical protein TeGR_g7326, partial [Tetraparma gracilis]